MNQCRHHIPCGVRQVAILALLAFSSSAAHAGNVVELEIKGGIGVATAEYVISGLDHAAEQDAELVIINMDTPGGLVSPMRDIITAILNSKVPVATYVTPDGARADSAGTYILLASHIAVMAPTTHMGAATPVTLTGEDATPPPEDETEGEDTEPEPEAPQGTAMERKVMNDAVTYIRNLAERNGRNADWAELAVTEAATLTAKEALEQNVIEFIAEDRSELLQLVNGFETEIDSETVAIDTTDAVVVAFEPNWRLKILAVIAQPEIVLLLGIVGIYGLIFEGYNPGAIVPGVVGVICLLLAAYALQVLPVNYAGVLLILVGLSLMIAEAFAPSFGALGLGGIVAFVFGAIMMFDSDIPGFGVSISFVVALALAAAGFIIWLLSYLVKLRKRGAVSGADSIVGGIGTAMDNFTDEGRVWLESEAWSARSDVAIQKGQQVVVTALDGLTLVVKPVAAPDSGEASLQT